MWEPWDHLHWLCTVHLHSHNTWKVHHTRWLSFEICRSEWPHFWHACVHTHVQAKYPDTIPFALWQWWEHILHCQFLTGRNLFIKCYFSITHFRWWNSSSWIIYNTWMIIEVSEMSNVLFNFQKRKKKKKKLSHIHVYKCKVANK